MEFLENVDTVQANVDQAWLITKKIRQIIESKDQNSNLLIDLSRLKTSAHYPSPQARKIYADSIDHPKIDKIAVITPSPILKAIISFTLNNATKNQKYIQSFSDRQTAEEWLEFQK